MKMKQLVVALLISNSSLMAIGSYAQDVNTKKEIGLQLYSVRSKIGSHVNTSAGSTDYQPILKTIANMGYTSVETAGYKDGKFYNSSPDVFKTNVENVGMKVLSSHVTRTLSKEELRSGDFTAALTWWKEAITAHKAAGMQYIVTPWLSLPESIEDLETECRYLNEVGKLCHIHGIKYGYHNHAHEFQKVEDKVVMLDYMLENTNPEYVFFELDVYWTVIGKASPVDYFKKYPSRFTTLHIKDHREIGQSGMVGFDAIFKNAEVAGVKHIFVELEETTGDLESGLEQSIDYLNRASFVKATYFE